MAQLTAGLARLAGDPGLRRAMGEAARQRIEAYTWDRVADETMAVYREVVAERRR